MNWQTIANQNRRIKARHIYREDAQTTSSASCADVWEIGKYRVFIDDNGQVTYVEWSQRRTVGEAVPSIHIHDGEVRIALNDLTSQVLMRAAPVELAHMLWDDPAVRAEFLKCFTDHWSEAFSDQDRQNFLKNIKETVATKAIDAVTALLVQFEHEFGQKWFFQHETNRANRMLFTASCRNADGEIIQLRHPDTDNKFKIVGENWHDARAFWRAEILKLVARGGAASQPAILKDRDAK